MVDYIERQALLQIKRNYSRDEIIKLLEKQLREARFEIGVLKSEVTELKDIKESVKVTRLKENLDGVKRSNNKLRKTNLELLGKNIELNAKLRLYEHKYGKL